MFWGNLDLRRRKLPHWHGPGATYFVTWSLSRGQRDLDPTERDLVAEALRYFQGSRYSLTAWVVMNDHVHVIVQPEVEWSLTRVLHSWKSFTAHKLVKAYGRAAPIWLPESYDRLVRNEIELARFTRYIVQNPRRRWPAVGEYKWVWHSGQEDRPVSG